MPAHRMRVGPPHANEATWNYQLEQARRAGWPELDYDDLTFHRYFVEHRPTGDLFRLHHGQLTEALYSGAVAFFIGASGALVFLEGPAPGTPKSMAELETRLAEREQRRNPAPPKQQRTRWRR